MTQDTAPSRLPMLIVVAILVVLLAVALLWPSSELDTTPIMLPPAAEINPVATEDNLSNSADTVLVEQNITEDFTAVTPVGEANIEELAPVAEFVEPVIVEVVPEPLDLSDKAIKQGLITALRAPLLSTLIVNDSILANMVASVNNTAQGTLPENVSLLTPPATEFSVFKQADNQFITPESFTRYNVYAQTFAEIETEDMLALLDQYEPQIMAQLKQSDVSSPQ